MKIPIKLTNQTEAITDFQAILGTPDYSIHRGYRQVPREDEGCMAGASVVWRTDYPEQDWHGLIELLHETIARIDAEYTSLHENTPHQA